MLEAFDEIGNAAITAGTRLDIAVFGGSALVLASNFRFATEDVDIAEIKFPWPDWLANVVGQIARRNSWSDSWLNDAVSFHLSPLAEPERDHVAYGTFPRTSDAVGLTIFLPTAKYMLALKLKALRVSDFTKGTQDMTDVANLLHVLDITTVEQAITVLAAYFPISATHADKERYVVKLLLGREGLSDASYKPRGDV
jgi:hypothetical protein